MKMIYRGDYPPPQFDHGDPVMVGSFEGVIQHRRHNGREWNYGVLVESIPFVLWTTSPRITRTQSQEDL